MIFSPFALCSFITRYTEAVIDELEYQWDQDIFDPESIRGCYCEWTQSSSELAFDRANKLHENLIRMQTARQQQPPAEEDLSSVDCREATTIVIPAQVKARIDRRSVRYSPATRSTSKTAKDSRKPSIEEYCDDLLSLTSNESWDSELAADIQANDDPVPDMLEVSSHSMDDEDDDDLFEDEQFDDYHTSRYHDQLKKCVVFPLQPSTTPKKCYQDDTSTTKNSHFRSWASRDKASRRRHLLSILDDAIKVLSMP